MSVLRAWINLLVAVVGLLLLHELLFTYNNPIPIGCVWIALVAIKSLFDISTV